MTDMNNLLNNLDSKPQDSEPERLEDENARLKRELAQLKSEKQNVDE